MIELDNQNNADGIPFAPELIDIHGPSICDYFPFCCLTNECDGCHALIEWQEVPEGPTSYLRNPCEYCSAEEAHRDGDHDAYDRYGDR